MIGNDFIIEPEVEVDFVEKEGSYPFYSGGFLSEANYYPLCKAMTNKESKLEKGGR